MEATSDTNCVCDFILEAGDWAEERDSLPEEEERGPLHGMPVSINEGVKIKGHPVRRSFCIFYFTTSCARTGGIQYVYRMYGSSSKHLSPVF